MTYEEVLKNARPKVGSICKACDVCNGRACGSRIPGPGAKGSGDVAIRNFEKWKDIRLNMDTICENGQADTTTELFGRTFALPVFAGPVGAVNTHYGTCYNDMEYNSILVSACAENGIAAFTGDGLNEQIMICATKAIGEAKGVGIPTVKPWSREVVAEK